MKKEDYALYMKNDLNAYLTAYNRVARRNADVYLCGSYNTNIIDLNQCTPPAFNDISSTAGHSNDIKVPLGASLVDTTTAIITQYEPELKGETISKDIRSYFKVADLEDYLSLIMEKNDIYKKSKIVVRNSLVFSKSALWFSQFTNETFVVNPYVYAIMNNEHNNPKWGLVRQQYFSVNWLKDWGLKDEIEKLYRKDLGNLRYVDLSFLYSILDKCIYIYFEDTLIKTVPFNGLKIPIDELYYKEPLDGGRSIGIIDESYASQDLATYLTNCVKDHAEDAFQPTILTKNSTGFKHISINTNTGQVYNVINSQGSEDSAPVDVYAPNFTNNQFTEVAEWIKNSQYQLTGVNISTAAGQLPQGVNSAEMVYSLNDLQNQRLQPFLQNYLNLFKKHLETYILNKPKDETITESSDLTWGDLQSYWENFFFKFDINDNAQMKRNKQQFIQQMLEIGLITPRESAEITASNDLKLIKRIIRKTRKLCYNIIRQTLNGEQINLYPWTPLPALSKIILDVAGDLQNINQGDFDSLDALMILYQRVIAQMIQTGILPAPTVPENNKAPAQGDNTEQQPIQSLIGTAKIIA